MNIKIKPEASPDGDIKVEAGGMTFYFLKGTSKAGIMTEVKGTINKEKGLLK